MEKMLQPNVMPNLAAMLSDDDQPQVQLQVTWPLTHTHTPIYPYTHTHIHPYTHTPMHPYTHTPIQPYTHTHIHPYTHAPIHPYTHHPYTHTPITTDAKHLHGENAPAERHAQSGRDGVRRRPTAGAAARDVATHTHTHTTIYPNTHTPIHTYTHKPIHT